MPIVSEHPRSLDVIRRLEDECDSDLRSFVEEYASRRKVYSRTSEGRHKVVEHLENEDRADLTWRELVTLLKVREAATEELHNELVMMTREVTLLKREMRRVRRRLMDPDEAYEPEVEVERYSAPGVPSVGAVQGYAQRARQGDTWSWLKPWLRGFLPNSA